MVKLDGKNRTVAESILLHDAKIWKEVRRSWIAVVNRRIAQGVRLEAEICPGNLSISLFVKKHIRPLGNKT